MKSLLKYATIGAIVLALVALAGATIIGAQSSADEVEVAPLAHEEGDAPLPGNAPFIDGEVIKEAIAGALGITVEELEAARDEGKTIFELIEELGLDVTEVRVALEEARTELIQEAIDEGRITQEQGDRFLLWGGYNRPGQNRRQAPRRPNFPAQGLGQRARGAMQEALAGALDITVEELEAAQQEAHAIVIEQALEAGVISQDQADLMLAMSELKATIDPDVLLAEALGITVDELEEAREEGKIIRDLVEELGLDAATVGENLKAARIEALEEAVADGIITQEQADQILSRPKASPGRARGPHRFGQTGGFQPWPNMRMNNNGV